MYDYLIVGSGFYGAICAYELTKAGYTCLVIDKRNHIGGNCYTENKDEINIHTYGPHIFHTSNEEVWQWINQFVTFNNFTLRPVANYKGEIYSLPFNMWTFNKLWNITHPDQAKQIINKQSEHIKEPTNLEEQAIKLVGTDVYEKLIKGYTAKQWKKDPKELPKEIIKRLPVRFTYDNNYFNDKYQGIPIGGYTQIFEKLLNGIEVKLGIDYFKDELPEYNKVIYTGPIDRFYNYQFGELEYKTTIFEHRQLEDDNYQGISMMNYTDEEVPFTRVIEHKHFENIESPITWVSFEYPTEYTAESTEPMYPVNDTENNIKYQKYKELANQEKDIIFGGRLAEYKYYDMHQVIESALGFIKKEINENIIYNRC
jgi:UDP-galactopyranose mutase